MATIVAIVGVLRSTCRSPNMPLNRSARNAGSLRGCRLTRARLALTLGVVNLNNLENIMERLKKRNIVIVIAMYLQILLTLLSALEYREDGNAIIVSVILYILICLAITKAIIKTSSDRQSSGSQKFKKISPFMHYGVTAKEFQHAFSFKRDISADIHERLSHACTESLTAESSEDVSFTDIDTNLKKSETDNFFVANYGYTRDTLIRSALKLNNDRGVHIVRWWIFAQGKINPNKVLFMYAFSPLTAIFRVIPTIRMEYNALNSLQETYGGFYNTFAVGNKLISCEHVLFETYLSTLDSNGIDTADLRVQRAQMLNVTISGGSNTIGNIMQSVSSKFRSAGKQAH